MIKNPEFYNPKRVYKPEYLIVYVAEVKTRVNLRSRTSFKWTLMKNPISSDLEKTYKKYKMENAQNASKTPVHGIYKSASGTWALLADKGSHYDCILGDKKIDKIKRQYTFTSDRLVEVYLNKDNSLELWRQITVPKKEGGNLEELNMLLKKEIYSFEMKQDE